jgi:hypothetical protein
VAGKFIAVPKVLGVVTGTTVLTQLGVLPQPVLPTYTVAEAAVVALGFRTICTAFSG